MQKLLRPFYDRATLTVAKDLLGTYLVHDVAGERRIGRIVEVEAYLGSHDRASHSSKGRTARNAVMFGPPGHAYVYLIYGMYCCMNVVTEAQDHGAAVLVRALAPVANIPLRTQGPGLLCKAMQIDRRLNGHDLTGDTLFIAMPADRPAVRIAARPRIGVAYAGEWAEKPLRFYIQDDPFVSRK
ncbi:MAG: 3-methyladenine DNA glycosylase [Desulfatitalea sp. BRH_c12]|nr:MAG: 3-methyladenine DNA glycosylase [Desulfatitalea sp. BRH_c12]